MAIKATQIMTLADVAAATHNQAVIDMAEVLNETNEILDDIHWIEANDGTAHKSRQRTGLPTVAYREINKGVPKSKSTWAKATDTTCVFEGNSYIDEELYVLNGNGPALRKSEDIAFTEAMNLKFLNTLFYGDTNDGQEKFLGLTPRYSDPSAKNGEMLVDGGGGGAAEAKLSSIWLGGWGVGRLSGLYPKGTKAGLEVNDKGMVQIPDDEGNDYDAYRTQFKWRAGLTVPDWRYAGRICNINLNDIDGSDLVKLMIILSERVKNTGTVKQAWYVPRAIRTALRLQILNKNNVNLSYETVEGKKVLAFDGIPVREVNALVRKDEETEEIIGEDAVSGTFIEG